MPQALFAEIDFEAIGEERKEIGNSDFRLLQALNRLEFLSIDPLLIPPCYWMLNLIVGSDRNFLERYSQSSVQHYIDYSERRTSQAIRIL